MKETIKSYIAKLAKFTLPNEVEKKPLYLKAEPDKLLINMDKFSKLINGYYMNILENAMKLPQTNPIRKVFDNYGTWPAFCLKELSKVSIDLIECQDTRTLLECCLDQEINKQCAQLIETHSELLFNVCGPVRKVGDKKIEKTYEIISPKQCPQSEIFSLLQYVGVCYQALSWSDPEITAGIFNIITATQAMSYGNIASIPLFFKTYTNTLDQFTEPFPHFFTVHTPFILLSLHKAPGYLFAGLFCFYAAGHHMIKYCKSFSESGAQIQEIDDPKLAYHYAAWSQLCLNKAKMDLSASNIECWNMYGQKPENIWKNFSPSTGLTDQLKEIKSTEKLMDQLGKNMLKYYSKNMRLENSLLITECKTVLQKNPLLFLPPVPPKVPVKSDAVPASPTIASYPSTK